MRHPLQRYVNNVRFRPKQQQSLLVDMVSLVADGVPTNQALETMASIHDGATQSVVQSMALSITEGQLLAAGMEHWFPLAIVELVRIGEESGQLEAALKAAVRYYDDRQSSIWAAAQGLIYPSVVLVVALIMLVVIKQSVLVSFAQIKPIAQWPMVGQHLFRIATVVQYGWWMIALFMLTLAFIIFYVMLQITGPVRIAIDNLPIISLYRRKTAAQLLETLGLLVQNGLSIRHSLAILGRQAPPYLAWHLMLMEYRLSSGQENIADVLDTQLLDRSDMLRLRVTAVGKGFEKALLSLGHQAQRRYHASVVRYTRFAGGGMLLLGAMIAATMVLGIYSVGGMLAA